MLGRGNGADYPLGADLYPFCAKVKEDRVGAGLLANRQDAVYQMHRLRCGAAIRQASSCRFLWRLFVGASLLAMAVNDAAGCLEGRGALESIASKLAPTGSCGGYL